MFVRNLSPVPTMALSSKPKKIKAKGRCRELKVVQTVSRKGYDTFKTEEAKKTRQDVEGGPSTSQPHYSSSSPRKRPKLEHFDQEPIPLNLECPVDDTSGKRQTLVFVFFFHYGYASLTICRDKMIS
jgi:hypothetical protein